MYIRRMKDGSRQAVSPESDNVFSRTFGGMTKQEVTSLGDCSALAHYKR